MTNIMLKACPRCQAGAVSEGEDQYGKFLHCMNCGWDKDLMASPFPGPVARKGVHRETSGVQPGPRSMWR